MLFCLWRYQSTAAVDPYHGGSFLSPDLAKGGLPMSTSEVLELCLVIIGICSLFIQAKKK